MGRERNIVVKKIPYSVTDTGYTRRYSCLDKAVPRTTQMAMIEGKVMDVFEVYHAITGMALGSVKIKATGALDIWWVWEK